jgi:hypothetical protein
VLFGKASNSGCQTCSILQNIQNFFHGGPGRRQSTCTNDSKFENKAHFIHVTGSFTSSSRALITGHLVGNKRPRK